MEVNNIENFNLRIYGIYINNNNEVLISDEYQLGMKMSKFPGGGLKFGEGPKECLKRECEEELGQEIRIKEHFYTTDFFQQALFYQDHQLLSIYYLIEFKEEIKFPLIHTPFDFELKNGNQGFRFIPISELSTKDVTFPIDKKVIELILEKYKLIVVNNV